MGRRNAFTSVGVKLCLVGLASGLLSLHDPHAAAQQRLAEPGPELRRMQPMVGSWSIETTFHAIPSSPTEGTGKGYITFRWTLNALFLSSDYHSVSERGPYSGHCMFTYDEPKGAYRHWWFDSRGGGQEFTGHWDEAAKSFILSTEGTDHQGTHIKKRITYKLVNNDTVTFALEYGYPNKPFISYITSTYRRAL